MSVRIVPADLASPRHQQAITRLLDCYAVDPVTGGGVAMTDDAKRRLAGDLRTHPTALVLLAEFEGRLVGLAICFEGYSTFAARPLLNLHDLVVDPDCRGEGIGGMLLVAVEDHARRRGCVSLTLEVIGANTAAQRLYRRHGYAGGESIKPESAVMFFKKKLG